MRHWNREFEVKQMQKEQAQRRETKLIIFSGIGSRRTWKHLGNGRDGSWEMQQRSSLKLKLLWSELDRMHTKKLLWLELVFTQKVIKALQNERGELLMVMGGSSHSPVWRRWKVGWNNKCWVIDIHLRAHYLSCYNLNLFFLLCNIYFMLNVYGPVKSTPACLGGLEPHSISDNTR